jgi:hypothetical protein
MKKLIFMALIALFIVQSAVAEPHNLGESFLISPQPNYQYFSYLSPEAGLDSQESEGFILPETDINKYKNIISEDSELTALLYIAEEISPAVERYAFDDNATQSQLYVGLSSALVSYAVRKMTGNQFDLRLHEEIKSDNKSSYSVELAFRPVSAIGVNLLVPNGEFMLGLSIYPSDNTVFSFIINDNETATVTGVNINAVF